MSSMAGCLRELKRYSESTRLLLDALDILVKKYGEDNLLVATCLNNLGLTYKKNG
jgi:hypothetical protein